MKLLRTDSGGENFTDERLAILKKMLLYYQITKIFKLHDHKGLLTVTWIDMPTKNEIEKVNEAWEFFNESEIEHKLLTVIDL